MEGLIYKEIAKDICISWLSNIWMQERNETICQYLKSTTTEEEELFSTVRGTITRINFLLLIYSSTFSRKRSYSMICSL